MYHAVTRTEVRDGMQMSVSAAQFAAQMASLRALDIEVVSLAEGALRLRNGFDRLAVSVVFDDGFVGVYDQACEILATHRIPATIFVTTGWIGQSAFPGGDRLLGRPLTWNEVRALIESGTCSVGSHGSTHAVLARLSAPEIDMELRRSRDAITGETGHQPRHFAYPFGTYGTYDARTRRAVRTAGFDLACTTVWGRNGRSADPLELRRLRVSWCDSPREVSKSLAGCYEWYRVVQRLQSRGAMATATNALC